VTGANHRFFRHLVDLIGSLHKVSFDEIEEIAVFDLGLTGNQRFILSHIDKVKVYSLEHPNPDLLKNFYIPNSSRPYLGWYAWKPAAIHQILKKYPYVIWLDSGCEIEYSLTPLFEHILETGYFLPLSSEESSVFDNIRTHATRKVRDYFGLDHEDSRWILDKVHVHAAFFGLRQDQKELFLEPWFDLTQNVDLFQDDGTSEGGWGQCRHDQTLLSILCYQKKLDILSLNPLYKKLSYLRNLKGEKIPFYISNLTADLPFTISVRVQQGARRAKEHAPYIRFSNLKAQKKLYSFFYKTGQP
jgi:hypothetical protein